MIEHVSERRRAQVRGGEEGAIGRFPQRIALQGARLLPLVFLGALASCERGESVGGAAGRSESQQPRPTAGAGPTPRSPTAASTPGSSSGERGGGESPSVDGMPQARVTLDREVEAWLVVALDQLAVAGAVDLDLPLAMHLPILVSAGANIITPRMLIEHTSHLGAGAYADHISSAGFSSALEAQTFLVALGSDDTPGDRPNWRRANLDLMGWLLLAKTGKATLAEALSALHTVQVQRAPTEAPLSLSIREPVSVDVESHQSVLRTWKERS